MRIEEIRMTFNSRLPLYIVLTKLDLLRGFDSMYQSLDVQQRNEVLGVSFNQKAKSNWKKELNHFLVTMGRPNEQRITRNDATKRAEGNQRSDLFSFVRQIEGVTTFCMHIN